MKQLELGSLWNLEARLVSWFEMHFCKQISMCGKKIIIEGGLYRRSHNIPLIIISEHVKLPFFRRMHMKYCGISSYAYIIMHFSGRCCTRRFVISLYTTLPSLDLNEPMNNPLKRRYTQVIKIHMERYFMTRMMN